MMHGYQSCFLIAAVLLASWTTVRCEESTSSESSGSGAVHRQAAVFPGKSWDERRPQELDLNADRLDELAAKLGGRGCVVRHGYVAARWGDQSQVADWFSSAKPVFSVLLFFAIEEGLVTGVDQRVADFGWELSEKDRPMTFRHLGAMTSGYARPEPPGAAWAYNDFAIQLYQKTLFDRVFKDDPKRAAEDPRRLGALGLEDGLKFNKRRRISASVRDFARIAWFWQNRGAWNGRRVLPQHYFDDYMRPQTPKDLPLTMQAETDDYLKIDSFGGGSDHFTKYGAGIYGFNWWFNDTGRLHPDKKTWPDAPADTVMSIGFGGNNTAIIPSQGLMLVCASGDWNDLRAGEEASKINQALKLLMTAVENPASK